MNEAYREWLAEMEGEGAPLAYYDCPQCEGQIAAYKPSEPDEPSDTSVTCPHCGDLHYRTTWADGRVETRRFPIHSGGTG